MGAIKQDDLVGVFSIEVQNLSVAYGEQKILEDLNFSVRSGEFVALVGKSGTGKTTLLNALANFLVFKGKINLQGDIGFCFQNHSLFYWMTVAENIGFGINVKNGAEKRKIVLDILRKINLLDVSNKYPNELSGGQTQRVALGRAIAYDPHILLLDEPFSSLDIFTRDQMIDWVAKLISELSITVIMVTHYLDEAIVLADRIFVLKEKTISNVIAVPFERPRTNQLRYAEKFQTLKQDLASFINN